MKKIALIDTFGFLFKSYYALPSLHNKDGFPTSLLSGFANLITNIYKEFKDYLIIFALEGEGMSFRKNFYENYKANRSAAPQDFIKQVEVIIEWLKKMEVPTISLRGYEADDCIASIAKIAQSNGYEDIKILSHDKDLYQLIDKEIHIYDYAKKEAVYEHECIKKFGIPPKDFITFQSIVGDSSDNVTGIKGVGEKGALKIMEHFKSLEELYGLSKKIEFSLKNDLFNSNEDILRSLDDQIDANHLKYLESIFPKSMLKNILEGKKSAFISRELITLKKDLFNNFNFSVIPINNNSMQNPLLKILDQLQKYQLSKIISKIKIDNNIENFTLKTHLLNDENELFNILESIPKDSLIAFDTESDGLDNDAKMVGFSFCFDGVNGYYVPFLHSSIYAKQVSIECAIKALSIIFEHDLIGHNIKFDLKLARLNFNLMFKKQTLDSMILAWLIDPASSLSLDNLMQSNFNHKMISFKDVVKKGQHFGNVDIKIAYKYAAEDAVATFNLYKILAKRIGNETLDIAKKLEFPFIKVLVELEITGFSISKEHFLSLQKDFSYKLESLRREIIEHAGVDFNVNSPKQLSAILFEILGLKNIKKSSTDESVLLALQKEHKIIAPLLEYRELSKMQGTYVEPMLKQEYTKENSKDSNDNKGGKIYASFVQTGTTTGRLSSKSPNLQNIPVRTELGRKIREGFIASPGNILIGIDYSQIELRLLAHFSEDKVLVEAFRNNLDIHLESAKRIFKDKINNVESDEIKKFRNIAKSINFGLIYGMGPKKLSQTLNISLEEAKEYIKSYFETFPSVKDFLKNKENEILENGYSETLIKRKRYFDFTGATEMMKNNFLREGVNYIFQGSAADIIKLSMLEIYKKISEVKILVQIHDELIFETNENLAHTKGKEILEIMNNIYELKVPLACNITYGKNWAMLK